MPLVVLTWLLSKLEVYSSDGRDARSLSRMSSDHGIIEAHFFRGLHTFVLVGLLLVVYGLPYREKDVGCLESFASGVCILGTYLQRKCQIGTRFRSLHHVRFYDSVVGIRICGSSARGFVTLDPTIIIN